MSSSDLMAWHFFHEMLRGHTLPLSEPGEEI